MSITTTDLDVRPTVGRHPATRRHLALVPASISDEERVLRWGRSSVSPFTLGPDREVIHLPCAGVTGIVVRGGHAVMATDPVTPPGAKALGVSELLDTLALRGLAPVFAAVVGPEHYRRLGLFAWPIAEDAVIDLRTFSLAGSRRASIRHSVSSAGRSGLRTAAWSDQFAVGARAVSDAWLATKRGGEMRFTLGRFEPDEFGRTDCRVALDGDGRVIGFVTWHRFDDGRGRVLDLMRRSPDAPNPTMDLLIADSLLGFAAEGVQTASLGSVPLSRGRLAEHCFPTRSLWQYKNKFDPSWEPRHLVTTSRWRLPLALGSIIGSYCPGGLVSAARSNA